jgi:hypothetical protein
MLRSVRCNMLTYLGLNTSYTAGYAVTLSDLTESIYEARYQYCSNHIKTPDTIEGRVFDSRILQHLEHSGSAGRRYFNRFSECMYFPAMESTLND